LRLADGSVYEHEGKIETISGSIDPRSGTVRFRATFPNPGHLLRNGSSGTILVTRKLEDVLVVPALSTFEQQGNTFVYLVQADSLLAKKISVRADVDGLTVLEGLKEGDEILAKGVGNVRSGMKIIPEPTSIDSILESFDKVFK
jgi:membrane fusion protein (multidrug efflux system)